MDISEDDVISSLVLEFDLHNKHFFSELSAIIGYGLKSEFELINAYSSRK